MQLYVYDFPFSTNILQGLAGFLRLLSRIMRASALLLLEGARSSIGFEHGKRKVWGTRSGS